jgi:general stress protein 26
MKNKRTTVSKTTAAGSPAPKASRPHMPGYGMPTGTKGLLPWTWADERLRTSHNYYMTTVRPDATPHTMPVWGIWVDGRFYFSTGAQSRKARNLAANASCVICTDKPAEAVVVEGTASTIGDAARIAELSPHYARKYKSFELDPKMGPIFEVVPKVVFGLSEKEFKSMTRWMFA